MPDTDPAAPDLTTLTVQLLSAYVANNKLEHGELPGLIQSTRAALGATAAPAAEPGTGSTPEPVAEPGPEAEPEHRRAVSIEDSTASPDRILSMIDGRPYKTLRRHLAKHGLSPDEYRARYGLPRDYPLVAPTYSEQRRQVALDRGLGGRRRDAGAPAENADAGVAEEAAVRAAEEVEPAVPASAGEAPTSRARRSPRRKAEGADAGAPAGATDAGNAQDGSARGEAEDQPAVATAPADEAAKPRARRSPGRKAEGAAEATPTPVEAGPGDPATRARKAPGRRGKASPKAEQAAPAPAPKPRGRRRTAPTA